MMTTDEAAEQPDMLEEALRLGELGWRVVPIKRGQKHPPMNSWQHAASASPKTIRAWWFGLYRGHGVGVATGEESGVWVLDVDGTPGADSLEQLEALHGPLPATVEVVTGSGGRHLYFRHPGGVRVFTNRSQLGAGLDVRGDGGQVLAPPTIHPNGNSYRWQTERSPWEIEVAEAPLWLLELCSEQPEAPPAPPAVPVPNMIAEQDSIAAWYNSTTTWDGLLIADGWQPGKQHGNEQSWTRPGKDPRAGHSAVLHLPDGPFVIWSTSHELTMLGLHQGWAETKDRNAWCYSRFGYYAARHHLGNRSAAARQLRYERDGDVRISAADMASLLGGSLGTERGYTAPDDEADPNEWEAIALRGGEALRSVDEAPEARWGEGERILWAAGESLLIAGRTGVGKTTLTLSILAGLVGIEGEALGLPVRPAERVLYLAMDRPRQILRSMRRRFVTDDDLAVLDERLVVRKGPMVSDLLKQPEQIVALARRYGCDVVIVDSLKDAAAKLTDDEVGSNVNRAIQMCNAVDIDVLVLHHQRKGDVTQRKDDDVEPSVEDVFGSNWITAGAGSVIILAGQPGAEIVKLHHVKQPAEPLGPWLVEHDHHAGRSSIVNSFDLIAYLKHRRAAGATAVEAAKAEHQKDVKSTGREAARAKRHLEGLVRKGIARREDGGARLADGTQAPARWFYNDLEIDRDGGRSSRDGVRDGWGSGESVTEPWRAVTDSEKAQVTAVTESVTHRDALAAVTDGGGYIPPTITVPPAEGVEETSEIPTEWVDPWAP